MKYEVISKKKLRVRKKPRLSGKVLGYLKPGSTVNIDRIEGKWAHRAKGGYCAVRLLKKVEEPKPQPKPVPKPQPKPVPKPVVEKTNAEKIAEMAYELAYKTNNSRAKYPGGKPTQAYYKAFRQAFPEEERKEWKYKAHKDGANCGAPVGTIIRLLGIDKSFPHTSMAAVKHLENTKKFMRVEPEDVKTGDIIVYKKGGDGHICVAYKGMVIEAAFNKFYPKTTNSLEKRLDPKGKKWVRVYRAKG